MQRRRSKAVARREALKPTRLNVGTGVDLVVDLPIGAIDASFVEDMIGDIRAAYKRALERSWARAARQVRNAEVQ